VLTNTTPALAVAVPRWRRRAAAPAQLIARVNFIPTFCSGGVVVLCTLFAFAFWDIPVTESSLLFLFVVFGLSSVMAFAADRNLSRAYREFARQQVPILLLEFFG
jgi:hypothetical protein